jgi:hypothetical protein
LTLLALFESARASGLSPSFGSSLVLGFSGGTGCGFSKENSVAVALAAASIPLALQEVSVVRVRSLGFAFSSDFSESSRLGAILSLQFALLALRSWTFHASSPA